MSIKARKLRGASTPEEATLWPHLRNRQFQGLKFRRQYIFGPYVSDFVCLSHKIVIEVDSGQHLEQKRYDKQGTEYIEYFGFKVIRFWSNEVRFQFNSVLKRIRFTKDELIF